MSQAPKAKGPVAAADLAAFTTFVASKKIDDLPACTNYTVDGPFYEYIHLRPGYGRRVAIANPQPFWVYYQLVERFQRLGETVGVAPPPTSQPATPQSTHADR